MAQTITTSQAPNAKPTNSFILLTSDWQKLIEVDNYQIPIPGFGGATRTAPGVVEITSPLTLANVTSATQLVSIRLIKNNENFLIANQIPVEPNDIVYVPLNGQFLLSESQDSLEIKVETNNNSVTAIISYTQGQSEENDPLGS